MLLDSFAKHPSRSNAIFIKFPSPFCVAFDNGRSKLSPAFKCDLATTKSEAQQCMHGKEWNGM